MKENEHKYYQDLAKYFSDTSSEKDLSELERGLSSSREDFLAAKKAWDTSGNLKDSFKPDVDMAWNRFLIKTRFREPIRDKAFSWKNIGIAASVSIILVMSFWVLRTKMDSTELISYTSSDKVPTEVQLPDGSKVWLNSGSSLSFRKDFNDHDREVTLKGEAYFEVEKAEGKRFTVITEETKTEVIGTAFNVNAKGPQTVSVQVNTGKVAFSSLHNNEAVFLEKGDQAIYKNGLDALPEKSQIHDHNFIAWKTKKLVFSNTSLDTVATTLENYFNIHIDIPTGSLADCRLSVRFDDPSLDEVLNVLSMTGNFEINYDNELIRFSGPGCR